jgi:hypothetical protein
MGEKRIIEDYAWFEAVIILQSQQEGICFLGFCLQERIDSRLSLPW